MPLPLAPVLLLTALTCPGGATPTTVPAPDVGGTGKVCLTDGERHGLLLVRHPTEKRLLRREMWQHGERHGPSTTWHRNGKVSEHGQWLRGQLHGLWRHYDATGKLDGRGLFDHGRGLKVRWHPNGLRKAWGHLEASQQHGLWTFWHDTGKRAQQVTYDHGRYHGMLTGWHRDGTLAVRMLYAHGVEHGAEARWSESGVRLVQRRWQMGKAHGLTLYWHPDGRFKEARCFVWQRLRGIWRERDLRHSDETGPLDDKELAKRARLQRCVAR
ncbi:MAG: hypothetical protein KC502_07570 [Myxococcales bacterium]|nr:hypothetical protein [Myxococcales bacterium]